MKDEQELLESMKIIKGDILFSSSEDNERDIQAAREYVGAGGFDKDKIRMRRLDGCIDIIAKEDFIWRLKKEI